MFLTIEKFVSACYGYGPFLEKLDSNATTPPSTNTIIFVIVVSTIALYFWTRFTVTVLVVCSLMTKLKQKALLCQEIPSTCIGEITDSAREILATYDSVHSGFGCFFFFLLSQFQLMWLFSMFVSISFAIPGLFDSHTISIIAGFCIFSPATGLQVSGFVNCIDSGHKSLGDLAIVLRRMIPDIEHGKDRRKIKVIVQVESHNFQFSCYL